MKKYFFILYFVLFSQIENENIDYLTEGYYEINTYLNNFYFSMKSKKLVISNIKYSFHIIPITNCLYIIQFGNQKLGIDDNNKIILYYNSENVEIKKYTWIIYNIKRNLYFIKNLYNNKLIVYTANI